MTLATDRLSVAVIAPSRFAIREPYSGGLEAIVAHLVGALRSRGHRVELFAVDGSRWQSSRFAFSGVAGSGTAGRCDHTYPPGGREQESREFEELSRLLSAGGMDVVLNHSLHPEPLRSSMLYPAPMVTTLHTPAFPEMQDVLADPKQQVGTVCAVSRYTARSWNLPRPVTVVHNGVDPRVWRHHDGGYDLVWTGRLNPEKGAHLAIDAAMLLGRRLTLAGRIGDDRYFRDEIVPRLNASVRYIGHLRTEAVARVVGESACALVTPLWEEPFGLVAAEALSCGTPVAALPRGALSEILGPWSCDMLAATVSAEALAETIERSIRLPRRAISEDAHRRLSSSTMVDRYLALATEVVNA